MQFVETQHELEDLINLLNTHSGIFNLYYTNNRLHASENKPLVLCVYVNKEYYVVSFGHPDCREVSIKTLSLLYGTRGFKYIFNRKHLMYYVDDIQNSVDAYVGSYLTTFKSVDIEYPSRSTNFKSIPIMKIASHFKNLCNVVEGIKIDDNVIKYELDFSTALYNIEKNGMYVENFNIGDKKLISKNNLVFTQYNMLTPTGRPSNSFGNVNYVALNKKTGERDCFKSRFGEDGLIVMVDYESYHLRLVGNFLKFKLPNTSIHEYLGKIYHGKDNLSVDEYELSKKITFNLIYGGIDEDVKNNVPFMKAISEYVDKTFKSFNKNGYVETWYYSRKLPTNFFGEKINSYKVFNYLLQAAETERNCKVLQKLNEKLTYTKSKLILYTYDAFLFDVHRSEFNIFKDLSKIMTTNNQFPVRTYIGNSYGNLREI